jgi:hypothetical protein
LTIDGNYTQGSDGWLLAEIEGTGEGQFDVLRILGNSIIDGALSVSLLSGFELDAGMHFEIIDTVGSCTGMFDGLGEGGRVGTYGDLGLFITYHGGDGNDIVLTASAVPEPSALILLLTLGGAGLLGHLWRRRRG